MTVDAKTLQKWGKTGCPTITHALIAEVRRLQADNARMRGMREALLWIVEDGASDARAVECARAALAESDKP